MARWRSDPDVGRKTEQIKNQCGRDVVVSTVTEIARELTRRRAVGS